MQTIGLVFLLLVLQFAYTWADTLIANSGSYSTNDPITLTLITSATYAQVEFSINGVLFNVLTDTSVGFTGAISVTGFVTCTMGPSNSVTQLTIEASTTLLGGGSGSSSFVVPLPAYHFDPSQCVAYFTLPPDNPTRLPAATASPVMVHTTVPFVDSYVTLNGQFFCNIGPIAADDDAGCEGFLPCYLPACAQFALVAREEASPLVAYPGPTLQLIPGSSCIPTFSFETQSMPGCPTPYAPLSTIEFTFEVNPNDSVESYSNFEIWASNPSFPSNVFVARVAGPLCIRVNNPSTYLVTRWVIPCTFNNIGLTTFTLTYLQRFSSTEALLHTQPVQIPIGSNAACNLSLIVNYPGNCPLPYNPNDCGCPGYGGCLVPCANCPACSPLAYDGIDAFVPGSTLNFYVHNGSISSVGGPRGITANYQYFASPDNFQYAFSPNYFYFSDTTSPTGGLGYKLAGQVGNETAAIPGPSVALSSITAFPSGGIDYVWASDATGQLYCGTQAAVSIATSPAAPSPALIVAAGPSGLWMTDSSHRLWHAPSVVCNGGQTFTLTGIFSVLDLTSSASGAYLYSIGVLYFTTAPSFAVTPVPVIGGPATVSAISASNIDDSLVVVDNTNNVWLLSSPTGTWTQTTLSNYYVANYSINDLYPAAHPGGTQQTVNRVVYGALPFFGKIPVYLNLSLAIESSLPAIQIYSATIAPPFDSCDNALLVSWTIPSYYKNVGSGNAVLSYVASYSNGSTQMLSSSVPVVFGPTPVGLIPPRDFCPAPCTSKLVTPFQLNLGCTGCL